MLRQSFGGSNALVISLIQAFQERLCPADAQWLTFLQAQRFEKDFDRLVKDCQTRVLKKNPLQYMQGYEFLFDKDDRTNRIYVRREVAVSLHRLRVRKQCRHCRRDQREEEGPDRSERTR